MVVLIDCPGWGSLRFGVVVRLNKAIFTGKIFAGYYLFHIFFSKCVPT